MSELVARRIVASGDVQGVFFRDSTRREALRLGVAGWVRNCPDGTVEAHVEGRPDAVAALVDWARAGPRHAEVRELSVDDVRPERLEGFEVR